MAVTAPERAEELGKVESRMRYAGYSPAPILNPLPYSRLGGSDYRFRPSERPSLRQTARAAGLGLAWVTLFLLGVILLLGSLTNPPLG